MRLPRCARNDKQKQLTTENTENAEMLKENKIAAVDLTCQLAQVQKIIEANLEFDDLAIAEFFDNLKMAKGKMLRPAILLAWANLIVQENKAVAGAGIDRELEQKFLTCAAVIEMIHNATLIHDDVLDQADIRRATASVNAEWGNKKAILIGDILFSRAFELCTKLPKEIQSLIADSCSTICQGELRQNLYAKNWQITSRQYMELIKDKTAALFKCACQAGASLAKANPIQMAEAEKFGENFGIAFQLADDLNDLIANDSEATKTLGGDIKSGKITLAIIDALEKKQNCNELKRLIESDDQAARQKIKKILIENGSVDYVKAEIDRFSQKAIEAIGCFKLNQYSDYLKDLVKYASGKS